MKNVFLLKQRPYPRKLIVDIHTQCNARCRMCPYPRYARVQDQGSMPFELYQNIITEFADLGRRGHFTPSLTYCYMAEPFIAEDLERYTVPAQALGIDVYLNTNAAAMTPDKIDRLIQSHFHGKIHISFHGADPELYQKIMGLDFHQSWAHIEYLLEHYDSSKICIRGVDDNWPPGQKEKWFDLWSDKNVELEYLPPISRCGAVGRLLGDKLKKDRVTIYGCQLHHPLVEMVILYDGRAVLCCQDMGREVILGNVAENGLAGVWNSPKRHDMIKHIYAGKAWGPQFLCARCEQAIVGPWAYLKSIGDVLRNKLL